MLHSKTPNLSFSPSTLQPSHRKFSRNPFLGFPSSIGSLRYHCRVFSLPRPNQNPRNSSHDHEIKDQKQHHHDEDHQVHCEVDVISWRERRISAWVSVSADVESVWNVLTDYERLADFIPNLICSGRIPCPHPGRIWVEQRGLQRALYWQIEARVVLDLKEFPNLASGCELHFSMVDGDFKKFEGKWSIKPGLRYI